MTPLPDTFLERVAAAAVREGLADAVYTRVSTPIGRLLAVYGPHGLIRLAFDGENQDRALEEVAAVLGPRVVASEAETREVREQLLRYLDGEIEHAEVPVDLSLVHGPFRREVLETLHRDVGPGHTITYGGLAARTGRPGAARAVGTACATNPVPIVVPCHRVLPGSGGVGSYGGGPELKRRLLALEGALLV
jgi:methylated-DNA-[protein]-cysteine S-methyltransferase